MLLFYFYTVNIHKMTKKYYIIPVFYILIIALLVYLQFSVKKKFTEVFADIRIEGVSKAESDNFEESVISLKVSLGEVSLFFDKSNSVAIKGQGKTSYKPKIESYKKNYGAKTIDIIFSDGFFIKISSDETEDGKRKRFIINPGLSLDQKVNSEIKELKSVLLFYRMNNREQFEASSHFPVIGYNIGEELFFLAALGEGSSVESPVGSGKKYIQLYPDKTNNFKIIIEEADELLETASSFAITKILENKSQVDNYLYENDFLDTAYKGWLGDINTTSSPEVFSAFGSELIRRKEFAGNRQRLNLAQANFEDNFLIWPALIMGGTEAAYSKMIENDPEIINQISSQITKRDISVFNIQNLVTLIADRGPYFLIQELFTMAEGVDIKKADIKTVIGVATAYLNFISLDMEKDISINRFNAIINYIFDKIVIIPQGMFFIPEGKGDKADTFLSSQIAILLKSGSKLTGRKIFQAVGDELVKTLLSFKDENSFIPEFIYVDKNKVKSVKGLIAPEYIYPALESALYYPKVKSLKAESSPGTWIATCGAEIDASFSPVGVNFKINFPVEQTENIIVQGLPSISAIKLYGINWNRAANFERYYTGWDYNSETQTLFIKLQHRIEQELIEILF